MAPNPRLLRPIKSGTPPAVETQPQNVAKWAGATARFTSAATGRPDPAVQWQLSVDGGSTYTNIAGATSPSYTTPVLAAADDGNLYRAVWSNSVGLVLTSVASLTVGPPPSTQGGTETYYTDGTNYYRVHSFTDVGSHTLTVNSAVVADYLVVGGGGGSSWSGGGAGGMLRGSGLSLAAGSVAASVGAGGSGTGGPQPQPAGNGGNSSLAEIVAFGGGRSGNNGWQGTGAGGSGGSGGGGGWGLGQPGGSGVAGQGHAGSTSGRDWNMGAGGGAGGPGGVASLSYSNSNPATQGGPGVADNITGQLVTYAQGGSDRGVSFFSNPGGPNTGFGATGGGGISRAYSAQGGTGWSGLVVVRISISLAEYQAGIA